MCFKVDHSHTCSVANRCVFCIWEMDHSNVMLNFIGAKTKIIPVSLIIWSEVIIATTVGTAATSVSAVVLVTVASIVCTCVAVATVSVVVFGTIWSFWSFVWSPLSIITVIIATALVTWPHWIVIVSSITSATAVSSIRHSIWNCTSTLNVRILSISNEVITIHSKWSNYTSFEMRKFKIPMK